MKTFYFWLAIFSLFMQWWIHRGKQWSVGFPPKIYPKYFYETFFKARDSWYFSSHQRFFWNITIWMKNEIKVKALVLLIISLFYSSTGLVSLISNWETLLNICSRNFKATCIWNTLIISGKVNKKNHTKILTTPVL